MHQTAPSMPPSFSPLTIGEFGCLLGYRSDALASELYDEAHQRLHAVIGLLCALSGTPNLNELSSDVLNGCMQAIRLLSSDSAALYAAAWQRTPGSVD